MGSLLLFVVVALVVAAIVFGVTVLFGGGDSGLTPVEPDGRAVPLPTDRPLGEEDVERTKFDLAWRGYRMNQVDDALRRAAYDIGYKDELIGVLEAEVTALREGRTTDADALRRARDAAIAPVVPARTAVVPVIDLDGPSASATDTDAAAANGDRPAVEVAAVPAEAGRNEPATDGPAVPEPADKPVDRR
ncbi:MAG TPA: DivIVA domain-containing protein [Actinoplanes sp.]|jgi:DivIVA domain-containing protein